MAEQLKVRDVMMREVRTLRRDDDLGRLVQALQESTQDVFPVVDERGVVQGTVDEVDLIEVLNPSQRTFPYGPRKLKREGILRDVEDVMTPRPSTTREDDDLDQALRRMDSLRLPQLVVVDDEDRVAGLLRGRDAYSRLFEDARSASLEESPAFDEEA